MYICESTYRWVYSSTNTNEIITPVLDYPYNISSFIGFCWIQNFIGPYNCVRIIETLKKITYYFLSISKQHLIMAYEIAPFSKATLMKWNELALYEKNSVRVNSNCKMTSWWLTKYFSCVL